MTDTTCPQCRSTDTDQEHLLDYATCNYCQTTYYPTTYTQLKTLLQNATTLSLPDFKNPLTIKELQTDQSNNQLTLYLDGTHGADYKLVLHPDHTGKLYRRKGPSEQNQFGSKWTNPDPTWPTTTTP